MPCSEWRWRKTGNLADENVEAILSKLLENKSLDVTVRSAALRFHSESTGYAESSLSDMNEAVRLLPFDPESYYGRAQYWKGKDENRANADLRRAEELRAAIVKTMKSWALATAASTSDRNGQEAFRLAGEACQATDYGYWDAVLTLAAAYYECGDYKHAVEYGEKSKQLATDDESKAYCKLWTDYFEKKLVSDVPDL